LKKTSDLRIRFVDPLISPQELKKKIPLTEDSAAIVVQSREVIKKLLARQDNRLLAVVGPCSIHDYKAAIDYARRLQAVNERVKERIYILMRVYFEKPRTTIGWRGMIIALKGWPWRESSFWRLPGWACLPLRRCSIRSCLSTWTI
jgi:3-deoxy-7-phosphoheptulonate synthase